MRPRGQIVVIVAVLLMVVLIFLAVVVDAGRLYIEQARLARVAQAAADAGGSLVADQIVAFAATRQAEASAAPCPTCTPTPDPQFAERWLTDGDRAQLVSPALQTPVAALALEYAQRNGIRATGPQPATVEVSYPADYRFEAATIRVRVLIRRQAVILLAGLLGRELVELTGSGESEIRQR